MFIMEYRSYFGYFAKIKCKLKYSFYIKFLLSSVTFMDELNKIQSLRVP